MDGGAPRVALPSADNVFGVTASLTGRAWTWRPYEERLALGHAQRSNVPELVGRILAARGVGLDEAADFLAPTLRALLPDPSTLLDMDRAAARLADAVRRQETVAIFGDYDVDGACSTALLTLFLRGLGCPVLPYIPDRMTEGYGPNAPALLALADAGARLVVCVDCGTAAAVALSALEGRAEVLVLDHHTADSVPPVLATVNPNRPGDQSGLQNLCAAGVAFMTAVATLRSLRRNGHFANTPEPDLKTLLDLVALATICDVMKLAGLNRALVTHGLRIMAARARPGIAALMDVALVKSAPTAMTCGFALGPRINAGGRISEADLGLRLLLSTDPLDARLLAERLDAVNRQRQTVEAHVLDQAMAEAADQLSAGRPVLLVSGQHWHPGIVGIVAGRIKEKFNRPACVGGHAEGLIKGSGRSVPGLDLGAAVSAARELGHLATGGGHAMAAGFSYAPAQQAAFHDFLCERLAEARYLPQRMPLVVEAAISAGGATLDLARTLTRLAPFGAGNEEPVLVVPNVRVVRADRLGNDGNTIRAQVEAEGGARLKCLLFRAGDTKLAAALTDRAGPRLYLCGHLRAESWNGTESVSFIINDGAPA
jgi:single-stranded-DNA-specific exonuclease